MLPRLRRFFLVHHPNVIKLTLVVHVAWGFGLIYSDQSARALILVGLDQFVKNGMTIDAVGVMLIAFSLLATVGLLKENDWGDRVSFGFIMPQYFVMMAQFISDFLVIIDGHNPSNNMAVDRIVILTILSLPMALALFHTWAIVERWVLWPRQSLDEELEAMA